MSYNFINNALSVNIIQECAYDSSIGYEADFSENGNVDYWNQYSGIHTYGCWGGMLFGTFYGSSGYVGRQNVFTAVPCETHYTLKISMKINPGTDSLPTTGRIMWRTLSDSSWTSDKSMGFTIYPDNVWHTYILNMGDAQWWQGDVNDLRIYPMIDGADGDEFFIRAIKITSTSTFECLNPTCSYYNNYSHPCQGIGSRGHCLASATESNYYTIQEGVNDELIVNINSYGSEVIKLDPGINIAGDVLAKDLTRKISQVDIGGYAEVQVTYSEEGRFKIYSGTYSDDSSVGVSGGSAAETLGFDTTTEVIGEDPAEGFKPKSSFKIKSFQLLELFDNSTKSYIEFNPFLYSVEGGRRDWVDNGLASPSVSTQPDVDGGVQQIVYEVIENAGKTIIDFNHQFNASGKIKKIYVIGSMVDEDGNERTGCKLKIFRRRKNGDMYTVHTIDIPDRSLGKLYSKTQEYVAIDCDLWVNKGDLLGIYNVDVYVGKSYTEQADAQYFQVDGNMTGEFDPGELNGDGNAGLFFYARGDDLQKKLVIDVDLGKRVNIEDIVVKGESENSILEYNIARCLDIDWQVDLFGETHDTGYWDSWMSEWKNFNHANIAYGIDNLTDGIHGNENGEAADSFAASDTNGVIPTNPHYFWVNGDEEWVGIHFHVGTYKSDPYVRNFEEDPIAFTITFPYNRTKKIFKSAMYFKERKNLRNFALSTFIGPDAAWGDADDYRFMLVPEYTAITIDALRYYDGMEFYDNVEDYIFQNPCNVKPIIVDNAITNYEEFMASEVVDWNVIKHEFDPIDCKGFRVYTDYHKSTKINEMELYSYVENEGTNIADSTSIQFSQYEDLWTNVILTTTDEDYANAFIGNTPQYFLIEIEPITDIKLSDIVFSVSIEDVYVGEKGCEYQVLLDNSKIDTTNQSNRIELKNVYGKDYDLYVDIPKDTEYEEGIVFWSRMNDATSITKSEVGPGAYYSKKEDYPLLNRNNNCAINCDCYGLKNLIDGKQAYYSLDGNSWISFGTLSAGTSVDYCNNPTLRQTIVNVPLLSRNRWWKFGFSNPAQAASIREAKVLFDGTEYDCTFYYDEGQVFEDGPISDEAPHLGNGSLTGSYYSLSNNNYIGFDLGGLHEVDEIILYHNTLGYGSCTLSIYISEDNIMFGKYCDLDLTDGTHTFDGYYYLYFAVDLGHRYELEIVRNYGAATLLGCSTTSGTYYSNEDLSDPADVTFDGSYTDARWVRFDLYSGDGNTRCLRKIGVYPAITNYMAPGGGNYNHEWVSLGSAVTNYSVGKNLALNAAVDSSSYFGELYPGKITDGIVGSSLTEAWGSDTDAAQWIEIDLGAVYNIYRVKIYHGFDDSTSLYMISDYTVQISTDGTSYTTVFDVSGNTDFEREHVLTESIQAQYVKIDVTSYSSGLFYLPVGDIGGYEWFSGAVLREVEVNEYDSFDIVSSEDYPVVAVNLKDQFSITGHSLIGVDPEDTSIDWSNADANFCYSDSVLTDPKKISFGAWGSSPGYDQWVVVKRETATNHYGGPDYLKYVKVLSKVEHNPCEYYWWWSSDISTLSGDHFNVKNCAKSLKIEYPACSGVENIELIEGDTFGTDDEATWRDAFSFWFYIDDLSNLDSDYGYISFGSSNIAEPVEYRWNWSSLVPNLFDGWNNLFLRFKSADEVIYTDYNDVDLEDPRIVSNLELKSIGMKFKGKGNAITMNLDGFKVERNIFMDYSKFSQGFYLSGSDYLTCPIADFGLSKGTIEFWNRPDYGPIGVDTYGHFNYRSLFHFANVANDVFGAVIGFDGISVYYGNIGEEVSILNFAAPYWDIDDLFHLAFVFSNKGTNIDIDGSTIRVYFNGFMIGKTTETWVVGDTKLFKFFLGGKGIHAVKESFNVSSFDGVVSNFKIYNYCKTDFSDSLANYEVDVTKLTKANDLIEISKDNVTFYKVGDTNLPLVYEAIPNGNTAYVYVRSCLPETLIGKETRSATIDASWFISV